MTEPARDPGLDRLDALVGAWDTELTHPDLPGITRGRASFAWLEGRAFLIWRGALPPGAITSSIAIMGGGTTPGVWPLHYFDSRGVSRLYTTSVDAEGWKMWRDHPGLSQRATGVFLDDGRIIRWRSELQREGPYKPDLEVAYRRRVVSDANEKEGGA